MAGMGNEWLGRVVLLCSVRHGHDVGRCAVYAVAVHTFGVGVSFVSGWRL